MTTVSHTLNTGDIHALLAHRYPFLLVDAIEVLTPGEHVMGRKLLSASEWWANDRPDARFPFVLVLEALAQASGGLIQGLTEGAPNAIAYFMAADRVRFRAPARAGDELFFEIRLRQWRRGVCRTRGIARLQSGAVVARADLTTIVRS